MQPSTDMTSTHRPSMVCWCCAKFTVYVFGCGSLNCVGPMHTNTSQHQRAPEFFRAYMQNISLICAFFLARAPESSQSAIISVPLFTGASCSNGRRKMCYRFFPHTQNAFCVTSYYECDRVYWWGFDALSFRTYTGFLRIASIRID